MIVCPACGKENPGDSRHCTACGTALFAGRSRFSPEPVGILLGIALIAGLYLLPLIPLTSLDGSVSVVTAGWVPLARYGAPAFGDSLFRWLFYLLWLAGLSLILLSLCRRVKA